MGRYLKGPFPLGSVLCTYERPLEIQYNTIHPLPSVQDIVQCIPAGTAFFAKMEAIHGYFQLALI